MMTLNSIPQMLKSRKKDIDDWFAERWKNLKPQIYASCDLRHAGFKIGVVDTNLFPAGFNNLCQAYSRQLIASLHDYLNTYYPQALNIMVLAEEHTRNKFYLKNVRTLKQFIEQTGRRVRIGVFGDFLSQDELSIDLDEESVTLYRIKLEGDKLTCRDFTPDLIISNNDFSSGVPSALLGIAQEIIPPTELGWQKRRKSDHFRYLHEEIGAFCRCFDLDPWLLTAQTEVVSDIDLLEESCLQVLANRVDQLLKQIKVKYQEYQIEDSPYVYLKNNAGTYGLGLLPLFSGEEVLSLSRRKKNKLLSSKGNLQVAEYLIQEGIPTADLYSGYPLEPVIYLIGGQDIGGFFRIHEAKNVLESLNAPGMTFSCLCLHKLDEPHEKFFLDCRAKESVVNLSRLLAKLAAVAVARE
ncbi:MAG: glutamate--cysteine ligase [Chlamydiota bacterium]|nr:glutamate--cysteine ligase [Chlamydiota bacterium]